MSSNNFSSEFNNLQMDEFNFMPFFEIRTLKDIDNRFDIFTSNTSNSENETFNWDKYL